MAAGASTASADRRLDRDIRRLYALGGLATAALLPFFTPLLQGRGITPDRIGLILSASAFVGVIAAPLWSHEADTRLGTTRALRWSSIATAVCALALIPTGADPWVVGTVAALMAMASAPGTAFADALALRVLGPERADDFGRIRRFASGGWAIAVVLFGLLYQVVGLSPELWLYAAAVLVYAAYLRRFPRGAPEPIEQGGSRLGSVSAAFRESPNLPTFLAGLLLLSAATSSTDGFVPLRMLGAGGGPFLIGVAAGVAAVIEIPFFTASASLGARFGMRNLFLAGTGVVVVTLVGWSLVDTPAAVAAFRMLSGAAFGLKYVALVVLTDRLVPQHLRNTGQALMQMATWGIGPIVGPAIGGFVYVHLGPPTLFAGAAVLASAGGLLAWWALRHVGGRDGG